MAGQVDREAGLSGAGGAHDDDEFSLVVAGGVAGGGGVHARPPWTAVEGKRRVEQGRMDGVERRENGFHWEKRDFNEL